MTRSDPISFSIVSPKAARPRVTGLLERAFGFLDYPDHFPHIFSPHSSAHIVLASNEKDEVIGTCAIDTELWLEPHVTRGACLGSVGVEPHQQGRGVGRRMLLWALEQLALQARHDFVYLFSDRPAFYQSLGFCAAGRETLSAFEVFKHRSLSSASGLSLMKPLPVSALDGRQRMELWSALEVGRHLGESCSNWIKFNSVCQIPELLVTALVDGRGRWHAGAFIGKGIDFQGVMHTLFAKSESDLLEFLSKFSYEYKNIAAHLLVAPGVWSGPVASLLRVRECRTLFLIRGLLQTTESVTSNVERQYLYPRALFSS